MLTTQTLTGWSLLFLAAALGASLAVASPAHAVVFGDAELVSRPSSDAADTHADAASYVPAVSADGRYVAFESWASNLGPDHAHPHLDVFLRDTQTARTALLSRASRTDGGAPGNDPSFAPAISSDGRFVAFASRASNLVPGDDNGYTDIFLRDTATDSTIRVSQGSDEESNVAVISNDGRYVAFSSLADSLDAQARPGAADVFVWDRVTRDTRLLTPARSDGPYFHSAALQGISGDGRYVLIRASGDPRAVREQVFRVDRLDGDVELVSRADGADGAMGDWHAMLGDISGDGRYVAFESGATNLSVADNDWDDDVYLRDMVAGTTRLLSPPSDQEPDTRPTSASSEPSISDDGTRVAFRMGSAFRPEGGPDYRYLGDIVVWDAQLQEITLVSHTPFARGARRGDESSEAPSISADGRSIAFWSSASELSDEDTDEMNAPDTFIARGPGPSDVLSGDPSSPSGPKDQGGGPGSDGASPELRLDGRRTQRLRRTIRVRVTAVSEGVWLAASGRMWAPARSSAYRLNGTTARFLAQGSRATVSVRLSARAYRAARRALASGRRVTARITVTVRDAAGNRSAAHMSIRLRR